MSEQVVGPSSAAERYPDGQWVEDADGSFWCLVDTHMGFPQRMAMAKGGKYLTAIENLAFPLRPCRIDLGEPCPHRWGLVAEGHCRRCGELIEWRPLYFDGQTKGLLMTNDEDEGLTAFDEDDAELTIRMLVHLFRPVILLTSMLLLIGGLLLWALLSGVIPG
jgi:hypothetical protein